MNHRFRTSIRLLTIVFAVVLPMPAALAGQAPFSSAKASATAKKWTAKTSDGQPDLQGYWTNSTYTPLQRPNGVTKEFNTQEEVFQIEKQPAGREEAQTEPGTIADVHYDFTQFSLDRSQSAHVTHLRTPMIIDPPDERIPPATPEGLKRQADRAVERKRMGATTDAVENMPVGTRCIVMAGFGTPMKPARY